MIKPADIPDSVMRPQVWTMWRVVAYTGKNGDRKLGETFVRAFSEQAAKEIGKVALRMTGIRGRYVVNASPYYPWRDLAFQGFIGYQA
jgi:hypothetical protein